MTAKPVQSVFFWRADKKAAFKAVYGRLDGSGYTKDFHQPSGDQARALERAFGIESGTEIAVTWRWPGGEYPNGKLHPHDRSGSDRLDLRWPTDDPPPPWRLHPSPDRGTVETMKGQPGSKDVTVADAQLEAVQATDERPWFIAVHLHGEEAVLHARLVLENPAPGREYASWETLPSRVREAMKELPGRLSGGVVEFEEGMPLRASKIVSRIIQALKRNPNVLLVGPPGTGKSVALEDFREFFEGNAGETPMFDPEVLHGAFDETLLDLEGEPRVRSVVFHPSYAYENFVIGLLPEPVEGRQGGVTVKPFVGPLLDLAHFASQENRRALLICDEFNRGAAASIFGDTLALLDRDKRSVPGDPASGVQITTPYHHLEPRSSDNEPLAALTSLPSSLYIVAAMNSADRSVAPLDAALRRRFSILYIEPDLDLLAEHLSASDTFDPLEPASWTEAADIKALAIEVLRAINQRIEAVVGRDFMLGHSVFWDVEGETRDEALQSVALSFDNQVIGTLALSFADNDAALAAVLNVDPDGDGDMRTGGAANWHQPSEGIRQVAAPRLRPVLLQDLNTDGLIAALASLL